LPRNRETGANRQLAFPANAEARMMIQRVILSEYEKMVGASEPMSNHHTPSERLRALEQLKNDGLISVEEYHTKPKEILEEL